MASDGEITRLLRAARDGDSAAVNELFPLVYQRLRSIARSRLRRMRPGETFDSAALVHEAYLKLVDHGTAGCEDRGHFFAVASRAMRQILLDYIKLKRTDKRGGAGRPVTLDEGKLGGAVPVEELLALDEAMQRLEQLEPRLCRVVELRFFGGLSVEETARALDINSRTVKRDWRKARALLYAELGNQAPEP